MPALTRASVPLVFQSGRSDNRICSTCGCKVTGHAITVIKNGQREISWQANAHVAQCGQLCAAGGLKNSSPSAIQASHRLHGCGHVLCSGGPAGMERAVKVTQ